MNVKSNPIMARLVRRDRWPSLRMVLWFAFGLGLMSLAVATVTTLRMGPEMSGNASLILLMASGLSPVLTPPLVSVTALLFVDRDARNGVFELLRLTLVSEKALVWGYALAALYRWRILLMLVVGVMPVLVVGMLQAQIAMAAIFYQISPYPVIGAEDLVGSPMLHVQQTIVETVALEAVAVGMWGMNGLAALVGVGLGFRFRDRVLIVVAFLVSLLLTLALPVSFFISSEWPRIIFALVALLLPYGLTWVGARWVARWMAVSEPRWLADKLD